MRSRTWSTAGTVVALTSALAIGACGSSDSSTTSSASGGTSSTQTAASADASKQRAEASIAKYVGKPGPFPVTTPLAKKPPASTTLTFVDCGTPICAIFRQLAQPAAKAMGVKFTTIKAGQSADAVSQAFSSAVQQKPDGLMVPAIDPTIWQNSIPELAKAKIPIATTGIVNGEKFGLNTFPNINVFGKASSEQTGRLQADWVYAKYGDKANVAYNFTPELPFTLIVRDSFAAEMKELCPSCEVRPLAITISTIGNKAPQTVVSDLQSHPKTNVVVASNSEAIVGLPQALKVAGLSVAQEGQMVEAGKTIATVGASGSPQTLEYLKNGQQTVDLATDLPVLSWTLVDAAVRGKIGPEDPEESKGFPVNQFLSKKDITFDFSKGWSGYPDFAKRFTKLWNP